MKSIIFLAATAIAGLASAFNNECNDNIVDYWGQNSYGAANGNDPSGWQQPLKYYCDDDAVDVLPIAFVTNFFGVGGKPQINLANYCNSVDNSTFPGTGLANCANIAPEIKYCQSKGKIVTISLGGATAGVGFKSDAQADEFADTLWNVFFGGSSDTRPFGDAILDGVDLDIEGGGPDHYITFLKKLNTHFSAANKKYYVTAAPQCVYPDANLQQTINNYPFDAVYVQFYNNPCGLQNFNTPSQWNFGTWDIWARTISPNPKVKIYIGAPASASAAGGGYVPADTLANIVTTTRNNFPSFGGVMFWDASQAHKNGRIDKAMKDALASGKKCDGSFKFPPCSATTWVAGQGYTGGSKVSYDGYIWAAKWYATQKPSGDINSDWAPISSCVGDSGSNSSFIPPTISSSSNPTRPVSSSATTINLPTTTSTDPDEVTVTVTRTSTVTVTAVPTAAPTNDNTCSGVDAWSSSTTYSSPSRVIHQGNLWQAQWWSLNDTPGGSVGVWSKIGPCSAAKAAKRSEQLNDTSINCEYNARWSNKRTYKAGSRVVHNGAVYVASSLTSNEAPDSYSQVWRKDLNC